MSSSTTLRIGMIATLGAIALSPVQARHHHFCLRFNKATGAGAGAVAGGLIAKAVVGGPVGIIAGAAAGGIAGHSIAHNRPKHCRHD